MLISRILGYHNLCSPGVDHHGGGVDHRGVCESRSVRGDWPGAWQARPLEKQLLHEGTVNDLGLTAATASSTAFGFSHLSLAIMISL